MLLKQADPAAALRILRVDSKRPVANLRLRRNENSFQLRQFIPMPVTVTINTPEMVVPRLACVSSG
jgi:hypothetical protein